MPEMRMWKVLLVAWYFAATPMNNYNDSAGRVDVVGPFVTKKTCEQTARWAKKLHRTSALDESYLPSVDASPCWEGPVAPSER